MSTSGHPKKVIVKKPKRLVTVKKGEAKKTPASAPATAASQSPAAVSQKVDDTQVFDFFCPYCGQRIPTRLDRVGNRITCSVCDHHITVPEPLTQPAGTGKGAAADDKGDAIFRFHCICCGQRLSAARNSVGRGTICPTCHIHLTIPEPPKAPGKPQVDDAVGEDEVFKFFCLWCGMKLSAIKLWTGSEICCPGCKTPIVIPKPSTQKADDSAKDR